MKKRNGKKSMSKTKTPEALCARTTQTKAHTDAMRTGKYPERGIKLAVARVDLTKARAPKLILCLHGFTEGVLRKGADAFIVGPDGKPLRGDSRMRNGLKIAPAVSEINAVESATGPG